MELKKSPQHYVRISCTEFYQNGMANVESTNTNSLRSWSKCDFRCTCLHLSGLWKLFRFSQSRKLFFSLMSYTTVMKHRFVVTNTVRHT